MIACLLREHATCLSTFRAFLREIIHLVEHTGNPSMQTDITSDIISSALSFALKRQHLPNLGTSDDWLRNSQNEVKINVENTAYTFGEIRNETKNAVEIVHQTAARIQQNGNKVEKATNQLINFLKSRAAGTLLIGGVNSTSY